MSTIYDFTCKLNDGSEKSLQEYKDQVVLVVNTASKCGFTPQYDGLQKLQQEFSAEGFTVLGFPCNQFGQQEPGDAEEIANFCSTKFDVNFPLFAKVDVNGDNADPLFVFLKQQAKGFLGTESIKWNFTKFLINRSGEVIQRFGSKDKPEAIVKHIKPLL